MISTRSVWLRVGGGWVVGMEGERAMLPVVGGKGGRESRCNTAILYFCDIAVVEKPLKM